MVPRADKPRITPWYRRRSTVLSVLVMIALIVVKTFYEERPKVKEWEEKILQFLEDQIVIAGRTSPPDVLVIDISDIKKERWERNGLSDVVTPRAPLKELIEVFADLGARSIGVDVDFSPENGRFVHPDDPKFFSRCLEISEKKRIPILLGVARTYKQPYKWLGDDRYMRLAAAIVIRDVVRYDKIPHWIRTDNGYRLPSMSAALAKVDVEASTDEASILDWFVRSTSMVNPEANLNSKESLIDYAPLKWIKYGTEPAMDAASFRKKKEKIENRMILLGDAHPEHGDLFKAGAAGMVPGVFVHACAANTIANEPLYYLTSLGRITMDLVLGLLILVLVIASEKMLLLFKRHPAHVENRLNLLFTFLVIALVFVVSIWWAHKTRLLWTDFLLVCAVLIVQLAVDIFKSRFKTSSALNLTS